VGYEIVDHREPGDSFSVVDTEKSWWKSAWGSEGRRCPISNDAI
jgi:hypothetical protein